MHSTMTLTSADVDSPGNRSQRRQTRFDALRYARRVTSRPGGQTCMNALQKGVTISADQFGGVSIRGAKRCASPWSCPVCTPTISERRALEIAAAVAGWRAQGGRVMFVTATIKHRSGLKLADLLTAVQSAWSRTFSNASKLSWYGGQIRALEITHGRNGWHVHVHAALFIEAGTTLLTIEGPLGATKRAATFAQRWQNACHREGFQTDIVKRRKKDGSLVAPGFDIREVFDADPFGRYLDKASSGWDIGHEIASSARKGTKVKDSTTPFGFLRAAMNEPDAKKQAFAASMWDLYDRATAGRRHIVRSPGLYERCGVVEASEEDAAVGEEVESPTVAVHVPAKAWRRMLDTGEAGLLLSDLVDVSTGRSTRWLWPPGWLCVGIAA